MTTQKEAGQTTDQTNKIVRIELPPVDPNDPKGSAKRIMEAIRKARARHTGEMKSEDVQDTSDQDAKDQDAKQGSG